MKMDREETKMGRDVGIPLNTNAERGEVEERHRKCRVCESWRSKTELGGSTLNAPGRPSGVRMAKRSKTQVKNQR